MTSGSISSWSKREGDSFGAGDVLCTIDTDKASVDFESQDDGILAKILRDGASAQDLPVGTPICVTVEEEEDVAAFADFVPDDPIVEGEASSSEPPAAAAVSSSPASPAPTREVEDAFALMPSARHLAESKGVDATGLAGSGKGGRVTKGDVLEALASGVTLPPLQSGAADTTTPGATEPASVATAAAAPPFAAAATDFPLPVPDTVAAGGGFEDVANNKMRKIIAARLTESKREVPHSYTSQQVEVDQILAIRKQLVAEADIKVSVNDFVIRCSALALRDVPEVNAMYDPVSDTVSSQPTIDVCVAVATPTGLITPIVPRTDQLGLSEISAAIRDLAGRAREGKLAPHEFQGGTFTVSNLGMFGINEFAAVINPPQAAILAVGGGSRTVVPTPYSETGENMKPSIKTLMTAQLSSDRRVVDEANAALFMSAFRQYMNQPQLLLL